MEEDVKVPKVFISYSWSSDAHKQWVLELAKRLVAEAGVEVILDRWHLKIGHDRYKFMEDSIRKADKVIVICDKTYCEKANNRVGGVGSETMILTPEIYEDTKQDKFIPIAMESSVNNQLLLPDFIKSRLVLPLLDKRDFEKQYEDLIRLIWDEPRLTPPKRGNKPDFKNSNESSDDYDIVFDKSNSERIIWLLPRGFLLLKDITYEEHDSWAITVHYFNYNGEWQHSTHYHDSYYRDWDDMEIQFRKLSIPKADWLWCRAPLNLVRNLRNATTIIDIAKVVQSEKQCDYPVYYYSSQEPIPLHKVPSNYHYYYKNGKLRDILEYLNDKQLNSATDLNELHSNALTIRQSTYIECLKFLGENNPLFQFVKEVLDEYDKSFSLNDLISWFERIKNILSSTLNHAYDDWNHNN
ncbi:toll/interleukin-1 receptor domain-containing protein [Bacillus halotolerans]|uniref:toll/interleukin-1 receptor domain-containing protein n=1 Tax=Bacillus halotolerans TaxID=260554 RepID=UPI00192D9843|nr:toll/interleukin-1 receptor domain-containing protein [Bacillus halotolerans]MBL6010717.1 toll/interleukin-1 receptor domain-containing protein [Bacillus halotolerans]